MFVIKHKDGGYLRRNENSGWERTGKLSNATPITYEKACNVLQNCISPALRHVWEIVEYSSICSFDREATPDFDWHGISEAQAKLYSDLKHYGEVLSERLSMVDLEICDIQHYIEFFSLDAAKGYKAYRMLKTRLQQRRGIKDEMAKVNILLSGNPVDYSSGKIEKQLIGYERCSYKPRVLTELFGMDDSSTKLAHVS